jgi:beta-galactosidase GanA
MIKKSVSRREFVCRTSAGLTLSFSGLRVVLGAGSDIGHRQDRESPFIYGTAFYRPPDPPASERREILKEISQRYKFNTARIFSSWAYCNPEPHRFDFSELEELMSYCDEYKLRVLMGVMLEDAPFWLEAEHPEARYVSATGSAIHLGGGGNNVSAGAPGLCLDCKPIREYAAEYIRAMARLASSHSSMYAYDCWNEPQIEPSKNQLFVQRPDVKDLHCYCVNTISSFQRWLQKRYGVIEQLNKAWTRRYSRWDTIDPPRRLGTYADWVDWLRFLTERSTDEMQFRIQHVRSEDPSSILESHIGSIQVAVDFSTSVLGVNPWRMAELLEVWGTTHFPRCEEMDPVYHGAARLELTRSQAGHKPFWLTELQGGYCGGSLIAGRVMRPRDIRFWNWMAVAMGAKGLLYWTYFPGSSSIESGGFALVRTDGSPTERVLEAAEDCRLIREYWNILEHYRPRPQVALLFDHDSSLLTFAASGSEDISVRSFRGYYKALWKCDCFVDFIESLSLPQATPAYQVVIAPWLMMLKKQTAAQLEEFVRAGGILILQSCCGMHNERTSYSDIIPPYGLSDIFGYKEEERFYISPLLPAAGGNSDEKAAPSERVYAEAHMHFDSPIEVTVRAHTFLTPLSVTTATVIAKYGSTPVAAAKQVGKGKVYYVGTSLGATLEAGDEGSQRLIAAILAEAQVCPRAKADAVRPRLIEGTAQSLLVIFNDTPEDQSATINIPSKYRDATDLYSKQHVQLENGILSIVVPYESVAVLLLS